MGLCGGTAVGTKLLHLRAEKNRQQPSHLHVINPYSLLAAFLPFSTHCLKLKRKKKKGRGEGTKITAIERRRKKEEQEDR